MLRLAHLAIITMTLVALTGCSLPNVERPLWAQVFRQREAESYRVTNEQRQARMWLNQYQLISADLTTEGVRLRDGLSQCPSVPPPTDGQSIDGVSSRVQDDLSRGPTQPDQVHADQALLTAVQQADQAQDQLEQAAATRDTGHCDDAQASLDRLDQAFSDAQTAAAHMAQVGGVPWP
jgi:hypothetical protein